jgi:SAM-dependent methyltransferase
VAEGTRADLVLANNVLAHAPQINAFLSAVAQVLVPGGVAVFEFPYACDLIERGEFDTIYHEHVFYLSLTALNPLLARNGLHVFDVERLAIHGGSLRVFASTRPTTASVAVRTMLADEGERGVSSLPYYESFAARVQTIKAELLALLRELHGAGKRIAAYGASAKGSTLLNFLGIGRDGFDCIDFVADRSTVKQGKLTPGSHLPIVAAGELLARRPDYTLLLTWNFADEILAQQADYRAAGGRFIIPVPVVEVV